MITPELKSYVVQRVIQLGLKEEELTAQKLGELLQWALNRMDEAACKYLDHRAVRDALTKEIYCEIIERG